MKDVFKNMRGAGLGGLLLMAVVFAVSVVLAGGLYFAKISRGIELNELNDEISAHRTIAPVVASLKARRVETEKLLTPAAVYDMPKDVRGLLKTIRVVAQDAGPSQHAVPAGRHLRRRQERHSPQGQGSRLDRLLPPLPCGPELPGLDLVHWPRQGFCRQRCRQQHV